MWLKLTNLDSEKRGKFDHLLQRKKKNNPSFKCNNPNQNQNKKPTKIKIRCTTSHSLRMTASFVPNRSILHHGRQNRPSKTSLKLMSLRKNTLQPTPEVNVVGMEKSKGCWIDSDASLPPSSIFYLIHISFLCIFI